MQGPGINSWVGKIPWRREWLPAPGFLPGESHGQRRLAGYSPWGGKESDTTEQSTLYSNGHFCALLIKYLHYPFILYYRMPNRHMWCFSCISILAQELLIGIYPYPHLLVLTGQQRLWFGLVLVWISLDGANTSCTILHGSHQASSSFPFWPVHCSPWDESS